MHIGPDIPEDFVLSPEEEDALKNYLEDDLPSLASRAALEFDDLASNRPTNTAAIERLTSRIESLVTAQPNSIDTTLAVVLNQAIQDSAFATSLNTVSDLIRESGRILGEMRSAISPPPRPDKIREMRKFCLAFSKKAMQYEDPHLQIDFEHVITL